MDELGGGGILCTNASIPPGLEQEQKPERIDQGRRDGWEGRVMGRDS